MVEGVSGCSFETECGISVLMLWLWLNPGMRVVNT